jgi:hypothetical protein
MAHRCIRAQPPTHTPLRGHAQVLIKGIPGDWSGKLTDKLLVQQAVSQTASLL